MAAGQRRYGFYGNNAVVYDETDEDYSSNLTKPKQKKNIKPNIKTVAKPRKKNKKGILSTLFVIICVFAAFSFIIARYSIICSSSNEISIIKGEIKALEIKAEEYRLQISEKLDMEHIQEVASGKLKMGFPDENQIVYIELAGDTAVAQNDRNKVSKGDEKNINVLAKIVDGLE